MIVSVFNCFGVNVYARTGATITVGVPGKYNQTQARKMLGMINNFRRGSDAWYWAADNKTKTRMPNLVSLEYDYELEKVAMQRAAEIAMSFDHTRPNGDSCFTAFPANTYYAMGENIAMGYGMLTTPDETFIGFREDNENYDGQGHRRNMLSTKYTAVGFACFIYQNTYYWVQEFGASTKNKNYVAPNDSAANVSVELLTSKISQAALRFENSEMKITSGSTVALPTAWLVMNIPKREVTPYCLVTVMPGFTTSDSSVARLSTGKVTGVNPGTAKLTAALTIGSLNLTSTLNVTVECNHTFFKEDLKAATHKERGLTHKRCTKCGFEVTEEIPRLSYYTDVKDGAWYFESVDSCTEHGFMTGYGNRQKFGPEDNLQRQDFVVILARIAKAELDGYDYTSDRLSDISEGKYYTAAVNWAVEKGIIAGYQNGKFGVGDPITREQVCTILYRYMESPEISGEAATLKKYSDYNKVSGFASTPVAWALQNKVINGMSGGRLIAPTQGATRAQIAAIIMNMYDRNMLTE